MSIDVFVIKTEKNRPFWESTFASLANHPIKVHKIQGDGKSMLQNFVTWSDVCTSEFISFVDDDDLVPEGSFEKCTIFLLQNPHIKALYTNSLYINLVTNKQRLFYEQGTTWSVDHHFTSRNPVHQLVIVQRKLVQYAIGRLKQLNEYQYLAQHGSEKILWDLIATQVPWHYLPEVCYIWRRHKDSLSYTMARNRRQLIVDMNELGKRLFRDERIY